MAILNTDRFELAELRRVVLADNDPRWHRLLRQIDGEIDREEDLERFRQENSRVHVARADL